MVRGSHDLLRLVQGGVDTWNDHRLSIRRVSHALDDAFDCDLSGLDLRGRDLSGFDLSDCNLRGTLLEGCNLTDCSLARSDLTGANLSRANLVRADLSLAELSECELTECTFGDTRLIRTNLASVKGMGTAIHRYSSIVDCKTLMATADALRKQTPYSADVWLFLERLGVDARLLEAAMTSTGASSSL